MTPAPAPPPARPLRLALLGMPGAAVRLLADALADAASGSGWSVQIEAPTHTPALQAELNGFDLVLLAGLESASKLSADAAHEQAQTHLAEQALRTALAGAGASYQVLYGTPPERLGRALHALQALLAMSAPAYPHGGAGSASLAIRPKPRPKPWVWSCDKCSDPQCEYRLLTDLLASRTSPVRRAWTI